MDTTTLEAPVQLGGRAPIGERLRSAARIDPSRFPRLRTVAETWAELASRSLNGHCASPLKIEFAGFGNLELRSLAADLPEMCLALTMRSPMWRDLALVAADAAFPGTVSEATFGGDGRSGVDTALPLTRTSLFFADAALRRLLETGNEAFREFPLALTPDRLVHDGPGAAKLAQALGGSPRFFVEIRFRLTIGEAASTVRALIPEAALAPHKRLLAAPEEAPPVVDETWTRDLEAGLQMADMPIRAILCEEELTLGQIATLQVGQTLSLGATMNSLVVLECENQRLFRGRIGRARDSYTVRVEEAVDPTEEFIDDILAD